MSEEVFYSAVNKLEFKEAIARRLLEQLILRGYYIPQELKIPRNFNKLMEAVGLPTDSFVVLVGELCREFRLDPVEYEVLADPAGQRIYTVKARIGYVERAGFGPTKRIARQLAAEKIYKHLRIMLRGSRDFDEEEAMFRAFTRTMREIEDEQKVTAQERQRIKMEEKAAAKLAKNKHGLAMAATVLMELDQSEHPEQTSYEVGAGLPAPGSSNEPELDGNKAQAPGGDEHQAAVQLLELTMERLGI